MPKHNSQKLKQFLSYKNFEVSQVYCKCTIVCFNDNIPTVISKGVKQIRPTKNCLCSLICVLEQRRVHDSLTREKITSC